MLLGLEAHYTAVPDLKAPKMSDKIPDSLRIKFLANTWDLPSFRFLMVSLAFSCFPNAEAAALSQCRCRIPTADSLLLHEPASPVVQL